ncbi:MAG: hypothetical protein KAV83_00690 [Desulfobacterales bacterium]|nr:hypothetical protein [Desulfobacterales bacterium]
MKIDNMIKGFRKREEREEPFPFDFGPKTLDELFDKIGQDIERVLKGEAPGWL